jgi:FkbM family methyltransferase
MLLNFNELIKKYNLSISGIIHIGAHYGEEYKLYRDNGISNLCFFEPLKENFKKLSENISDNETILVNKALGSEIKKIKMNVEIANNSQSSSILKPKHHLIQYPHIQFDKTEEVDMITLDSFIKENDLKGYNFINIDVQGYELEVFKGATQTLKYVDCIISEVNRAEMYEGCASVYELDEFLSEYGFERVETSWEGVTWGDALYIKK